MAVAEVGSERAGAAAAAAAGAAAAGVRRAARRAFRVRAPEGAAPASVDAVAVDPRRRGCFAAIIPGSSPAEYVITTGIASTLNIYNTLLIIRLILTWFPNPPRALVGPLSTLCDPYLGLFRGIVPPLGGLDFSPILAFVSLNFFTNAAAALPAEMPNEDGSMKTAPRPSVAQRLKRLVGADSAKASPEQ